MPSLLHRPAAGASWSDEAPPLRTRHPRCPFWLAALLLNSSGIASSPIHEGEELPVDAPPARVARSSRTRSRCHGQRSYSVHSSLPALATLTAIPPSIVGRRGLSPHVPRVPSKPPLACFEPLHAPPARITYVVPFLAFSLFL
jgi:hypothetical protein